MFQRIETKATNLNLPLVRRQGSRSCKEYFIIIKMIFWGLIENVVWIWRREIRNLILIKWNFIKIYSPLKTNVCWSISPSMLGNNLMKRFVSLRWFLFFLSFFCNVRTNSKMENTITLKASLCLSIIIHLLQSACKPVECGNIFHWLLAFFPHLFMFTFDHFFNI